MSSSPTQFFRKSGIYFGSNVLSAAIPFVLLPVLTRYLSPSEYGKIAMFQITVSAMTAVTGLGTQGAASRQYYDSSSSMELANFLGSCFQILIVTSILTLGAAYLMQDRLSSWLDLEPKWILWATVVSSANFVVNLRLAQWQIRGMARSYGTIQILQSFFNVSLSILLVVFALRGAAGRIEAQIIVTPILAILCFLSLRRCNQISFGWRPDYVRQALHYGIPLIPHVVGLFLLRATDRLVINDELGLGKAGVYMAALQLTMVLNIVFDAVNKAYVPWLYERLTYNDATEKRAIVCGTYLYFVGLLGLSGAAFLIGPKVAIWLLGKHYGEAGELVGWLVLGQVFNGMYLMVTNYIFYSRRTGMLSLTTAVSAGINLLLLITLVSRFGTKGAAWSFAISMAIRFALTWLVAHKRHPMPWLTFKAA